MINLILGVLETGFAEFVMEKTVHPKIGIISGLAVALNPSIIIFTLLSGAESIYASLIMCSIFFLVLSNNPGKKSYAFLASSGILCALSSFFRPTGIILIIAIAIQIFITNKYDYKAKILRLLTMIISFTIFTGITGVVTTSVSGYKESAYSFGWNLFIGANETSIGKWNKEDSDLFVKTRNEYHDPSKFQEHFANLGIERFRSMGLKTVKHFYNKLGVWTEEKFTSHVITHWQSPYTRFKSADLQQTYDLIINNYNIFIISGAIITLLFTAFTNHAPNIKIISYYIVGSILLFMVLETASRYKGAYYSTFTILAVYGYWVAIPFIKDRWANSSLFKHSSKEPSKNKF